MLDIIKGFLKPGVTDLVFNGAGIAYRTYGKWERLESNEDAIKLVEGLTEEIAATDPRLLQFIKSKANFRYKTGLTIGNSHRVRLVVIGTCLGREDPLLEISVRVHPVKVSISSSELDAPMSVLSQKAGLFLTTGPSGKTTFQNFIAQHYVRVYRPRVIVIDDLQEMVISESAGPVLCFADALTVDLLDDVKLLSPGIVIVGREPSSAALKQALAALACQCVVLATIPGIDLRAGLSNWTEQEGVSSALFSRVITGIVSVNIVPVNTRFEFRTECFPRTDILTEDVRNRIAFKDWGIIETQSTKRRVA